MTGPVSRKKDKTAGAVRPVLIGAGAALACMLLIMAAVSLVTLMIRKVTTSSILPIALTAAGIGCLAGGFLCARLTKRGGVLHGALVGLAVFIVIWLAGLFFTRPVFGTENAVKLVVLVMCGCFGGYIGSRPGCAPRCRGRR